MFTIKQSYVANTSCKMGVQNTWGLSWWHINFTPVDKTTKIVCFHHVGVDIFFSIACIKDTRSSRCRKWKQRKRVELWPLTLSTSASHFLACLVTMFRGGVTGRLPLGFFFSAGFKIYKRKSRGVCLDVWLLVVQWLFLKKLEAKNLFAQQCQKRNAATSSPV